MIKKYLLAFAALSSVLVAVPVLAETSTDSNTTTPLTAEERILEAQRKLTERFEAAKIKLQEKLSALQKKQANFSASTACVGLAVNKRESAVSAAFVTYSDAQKGALSARSLALNAAWTTPSTTAKDLRAAVNKAWADYKTAHKTAVATHNNATRAAWSVFKTEAAQCRATSSGVVVDSRASGMDVAQ